MAMLVTIFGCRLPIRGSASTVSVSKKPTMTWSATLRECCARFSAGSTPARVMPPVSYAASSVPSLQPMSRTASPSLRWMSVSALWAMSARASRMVWFVPDRYQ